MKLNSAPITRIILSIILLYFVYQETGWATFTAITLIFIVSEIEAMVLVWKLNERSGSHET